MIDARYDTVELGGSAAPLQATFVPSGGMLCCSLRHEGVELLAQNAGVRAYAQEGKTMGVPLLYPWANRLAGFEYRVAGQTVTIAPDPTRIAVDDNGLPIHGVIGGRLPWQLVRAPAPDDQSLSALLRWEPSQPELFEVFPFRHDVGYTARLFDDRLEVEIVVDACGQDVVPVAFGFHPYLSLPEAPRQQWRVELPAMRRLALDANQIPARPEQMMPGRRFELAREEFDDGFDDVVEPARFLVAGAGRRIALELLEGYPCAQVFAPGMSSFICFEPMTAPANALRSGDGLRLLAAGERYLARFSVSVHEVSAAA